MEERNILEIIADSAALCKEVRNYILNTDNYIFYWIRNKEVKDYIEEYPDDFEDRIDISIDSISGNSASVKIIFTSSHPHDFESIHRYCTLSTFRDSAKGEFAQYGGRITELKIKEAEEKLKYHEQEVEKTKKEIEELKKKLK